MLKFGLLCNADTAGWQSDSLPIGRRYLAGQAFSPHFTGTQNYDIQTPKNSGFGPCKLWVGLQVHQRTSFTEQRFRWPTLRRCPALLKAKVTKLISLRQGIGSPQTQSRQFTFGEIKKTIEGEERLRAIQLIHFLRGALREVIPVIE